MSLIDISYPYYSGMAIYPRNPEYSIKQVSSIENGDTCNISEITLGTHTGTHIDAPAHVIPCGKTIDMFPLEKMNGVVRVLDFSDKSEIGVDELSKVKICKEDIILLKTKNSYQYDGDNVLEDYVTLTYDAAELLVRKKIKMVGIDYMTIERPRKKREMGKSIHKSLLKNDILILETLSLKGVTFGNYRIHCFPINVIGADGCPVRVVLEQEK